MNEVLYPFSGQKKGLTFYNKMLSLKGVYTRVTSKCRIQLELETSLDETLIEENGCSLVEINNEA